MYIELSEVLLCPACGPDANLVLAVDEAEGRWVRSGTLACARCDRRYPVGAGRVDFSAAHGPTEAPEAGGATAAGGAARRGPGADGADEPPGPDPRELETVATEVAALLELQRRAGVVVLGRGLAPAAPRIAAAAERAEVVALRGPDHGEAGGSPDGESGGDSDGEPGAGRCTFLDGARPDALPVRERRLAGLALWAPDPDRLEAAAGTLGPGGRLVGLRPDPDARRALEDLGLEVLASEARAFVAARPD